MARLRLFPLKKKDSLVEKLNAASLVNRL